MMTSWKSRGISWALASLLCATQIICTAAAQEATPQPEPTQGQNNRKDQPLPDSPSASSQGGEGSVSTPSHISDTKEQPAGTAAAPKLPVTGSPASKPYGAAIAPTRQKQSRVWLIRLGVIAGAGVAVGTVAALSLGTSSKPPGAR